MRVEICIYSIIQRYDENIVKIVPFKTDVYRMTKRLIDWETKYQPQQVEVRELDNRTIYIYDNVSGQAIKSLRLLRHLYNMQVKSEIWLVIKVKYGW